MRALLQRVSSAAAVVDGAVVGSVGAGFAAFIGVGQGDDAADAEYIVSKTVNLRVFPDEEGRFNRSALDVGAELLVISQFTLYADTRRGRRPSFSGAAAPAEAEALFDETLALFRRSGLKVETGRFQAHMNVSLVNDGPVTIWLDSADRLRARRG